MGFIDYVDHGTEACGAAKITYADTVTVPQRIVVMTLTTVGFQICHGKMSKKSGSSQVSQVFFVYLCTLFCVYLEEYETSGIPSVLCIDTYQSSSLKGKTDSWHHDL